jgi:hypothetical protein
MEYLITPYQPTQWKINTVDFIENLEKSWHDTTIKTLTNPDDYYSIEWVIKIPEKGTRLDGALHRDGQGISLDGYLEDCATFAIWFQSLVPENQELMFYDQGYNYCLKLQPNTAISDIIQPFLSQSISV